ncbi:MAG: DUF1284 domain-containing protein [Clostridium sp.]|nr:DUF1284 domain-containing protein [Clostridium sp.]
MIKLRAHHFLCMQGFQGYGYNEGFTKNMDKIIKYIHKNKSLEVEIIDSCDDICEKCRNNIDGKCKDFVEIGDMDKNVLEKLQLESEGIYKASHIFKLVNEKIGSVKEAKKICGTCSWHEKCLWYMKLKKE